MLFNLLRKLKNINLVTSKIMREYNQDYNIKEDIESFVKTLKEGQIIKGGFIEPNYEETESSKKSELIEITAEKRIPLVCQIELLTDCNFKCSHCYNKGRSKSNLNFETCKKMIDQFKSLGGLIVILTGGEVLIHPEFDKIYSYIYAIGLIPSIITNGFYLDNKIELFKKKPPKEIKISLYGSNDQAYMHVTNCYAFTRVENNINTLKNLGINIKLNLIVTKYNYECASTMVKYANGNNIDFVIDSSIFSNLEQTVSNEDLRLDNEKAVIVKSLNKHINSTKPKSNKLLTCYAGRNYFFIDSSLSVKLCVPDVYTKIKYEGNLQESWNSLSKFLLGVKEDNFCINKCEYYNECSTCAIILYLQKNQLYLKEFDFSSNICNLAKRTKECKI